MGKFQVYHIFVSILGDFLVHISQQLLIEQGMSKINYSRVLYCLVQVSTAKKNFNKNFKILYSLIKRKLPALGYLF